MSKKIFPLPQQIVAQIAAGEVIERPVYAVKELIENSLDAGADSLIVTIEDSGLKKITVTDNGEGISKEDLLESFKPHTTSKLTSEEGLSHISTLGFRGEALASIAAVSSMTIASKTIGETAGVIVEVREGTVGKLSPIGMPVGTSITVQNLFGAVPARKKFLKSKRTEFRHIMDLMTQTALAYPQVHLQLSHNGKIIFDLPKTIDVLERVPLLLGNTTYANILPLSYEDSYVSISGFLTKPDSASRSSHKQFIFINQRRVVDRLILSAVKDAYGTLLESTAYPVCILFFSLPYEFVDVNVHPRKEEVRFADNQLINEAVYRTVKQTLAEHNLIFQPRNFKGWGLSDGEDKPKSWRVGSVDSYAGRLLKEKRVPWDIRTVAESVSGDLLQIHSLYLLSPTKFGMTIVDQHAAHERILYEQFLEEFQKQKKNRPQFILSKPVLIDMSFSEGELIKEHIPLLEQAGFTIEHFKANTFFVRAVPLLFQDRNIAELLSELLADLLQEKKPRDLDTVSRRMIAYLACRGAVKAGDRLTRKQAKDLLEKLAQTPNNATCPHGRPTKVAIDLQKLHKMFKRN